MTLTNIQFPAWLAMRSCRNSIVGLVLVALLLALSVSTASPASAATWSCSDSTPASQRPTLRQGDSGSCVTVMQRLANKDPQVNLVADGVFGPKTKAGVQTYQSRHGLVPDGIVGYHTWRSLTTAPMHPRAAQFTDARDFASGRSGNVSWAVIDTNGNMHAYNGTRRYRTASVVKAMILVERLRQHPSGDLSSATRRDLEAMIRYSDNDAAIRQYRYICADRMKRLAAVADMDQFQAPDYCNWGTIHFSAMDQAKLFYKIETLMPARHRAFGMLQLRSVAASHRWGLPDANDGRWDLAFKGGWLPRSCGHIEHQAGLFSLPGKRWSLAVLSDCNPSSSYGRATQYGIARLLR